MISELPLSDLSRSNRNNNPRFSTLGIQKVSPSLHHRLPLFEILAAMVRCPNGVFLRVGELPLDDVGPVAHFIEGS